MPSLAITNNAVSSLLPRKPKNCFTSSLFSLLLVSGLLSGLLASSGAMAEEDLAAPPKAGSKTSDSGTIMKNPPPELPAQAPTTEEEDSRNIPQPEVNIIHKKDMQIEEYRVNGRLRYVKITPKKGKPYYLVDKDGDGQLETRHSDLDGVPPINEWILKKW